MPTNANIQIPFIPQEGITQQILSAIQLANEQAHQARQSNIQQQQVTQQGALGAAQIEEAKSRAGYYGTEAAKNQIQVDNMRRAQQMFGGESQSGQPAQPQSTATGDVSPGPSVQQQVQMYPGSDLAKAVGSESSTKQQWLPQGTPPKLAPIIQAMIPTDLDDQEKNIVEAGAQTGRLKAMQTGDLSGYLNDIRAGVDSVVSARNQRTKNPENEPVSDQERKNFSQNVLPSMENLSPAQTKLANAAISGAKTHKDLESIQSRLTQQDNQALSAKIAQANRVSNENMNHNLQLDTDARKAIISNNTKWADAAQQIDLGNKTIQAAANGDDLATRMVPTMEVLGINMTGGIRRISPTEYQAAEIPASWANRFNSWVDRKLGGSTTPEMVDEGKRLFQDLGDARYKFYLQEQKTTAENFNAKPSQLSIIDRNGNSTTLDKALKNTTLAPKQNSSNVIVISPEDMK